MARLCAAGGRGMQMVFQDPLAAFNPLASVGAVLDDPLRIHGVAAKNQRPGEIAMLLERVGLTADHAARPVRSLSGGQRQRVAIARAIATRPSLLVLDEAVSALDVTVRGRILELLVDLQKEQGIACLFISHDLAVVRPSPTASPSWMAGGSSRPARQRRSLPRRNRRPPAHSLQPSLVS